MLLLTVSVETPTELKIPPVALIKFADAVFVVIVDALMVIELIEPFVIEGMT
jgi:hypothetical protein